MRMEKQIIVYEPDEQTKMEVKTDGETVWLTQEQMCRLFGRNQSVIARHISNVFKEGELPKEGFMQILHKTSTVGGRPVALYNLDVVISVGYRVKSFEGTRFRQWQHVPCGICFSSGSLTCGASTSSNRAWTRPSSTSSRFKEESTTSSSSLPRRRSHPSATRSDFTHDL